MEIYMFQGSRSLRMKLSDTEPIVLCLLSILLRQYLILLYNFGVVSGVYEDTESISIINTVIANLYIPIPSSK